MFFAPINAVLAGAFNGVHFFAEALRPVGSVAINVLSLSGRKDMLTGTQDKPEFSRETFGKTLEGASKGDLKSIKELKAILTEIHDLVFRRWETIRHFGDFSKTLKYSLDVLVNKSFLRN